MLGLAPLRGMDLLCMAPLPSLTCEATMPFTVALIIYHTRAGSLCLVGRPDDMTLTRSPYSAHGSMISSICLASAKAHPYLADAGTRSSCCQSCYPVAPILHGNSWLQPFWP